MALIYRRFFLIIVMGLVPLASSALYYGQSKEEVLSELGDPNGKRQLSGGEIWVYSGDISLEFSGGQLVRSKGTDLVPPPIPEPAPQPEPAVGVPQQEPATAAQKQPSPAKGTSTADPDEELLKTAESISSPESVREAVRQFEEQYEEEPRSSSTILETILALAVPTIIQWILLIIAFKWVGAEARKSVLLLIAFTDRVVVLSVLWFFHDFMTYPMSFHAEHLASFLIMLGMVTTMTHAKQLPQAMKIVIVSKVAGIIVAYLLFLLLLHNL